MRMVAKDTLLQGWRHLLGYDPYSLLEIIGNLEQKFPETPNYKIKYFSL